MQHVIYQNNEYAELKKLLSAHKPENICVVHTKRSYKYSGAETFIIKLIGSGYSTFSDFNPNPKYDDLKKGLDLINSGTFKLIIAIGGGTAIDIAKMMKALAYKNCNLERVIKGNEQITETGIPLLAIPTTAGTGAEATQFSVMYIGKKKYSISSEYIYPEYVYLDPTFSMSAPPYLTACTGLDALCQAVEALWCVNATEESNTYAEEAISLVHNNLPDAVNNNTEEAKAAMQTAAYLAGKAINITRTTAPHALSYAFTSYYGIPHGHAVAMSLPFFVEFNYAVTATDCMDKRGADAVRQRIELFFKAFNTNSDNAKTDLQEYFSKIGIETSISRLIENFDRSIIIDNVNTQRLGNNPRKVTSETISQFIARTT
ncbi:phosphonoacetaldehyde reductase [Draconibacterium halophilum]|uniref:Phosphonoacetaldehyde reductase n=1 Tax=Draconibacterium halophilum TaxID=2706887 RepID=A0A6C0RJH3_9BACT|nr:phosphonoacetaldehyde reductase [Draconibacterium halophilum]QIA09713.1 phosphonoacetaldehyde reductase [Draconibacterium halophilum]